MTLSVASFRSLTSRSAAVTWCPGYKSIPDLISKIDSSWLVWLETTAIQDFQMLHFPDSTMASDEVCSSHYVHVQLVIIIRVQSAPLIQVLFFTRSSLSHHSLMLNLNDACWPLSMLSFVRRHCIVKLITGFHVKDGQDAYINASTYGVQRMYKSISVARHKQRQEILVRKKW